MFEWGRGTEEYNPEVLFAFQASLNGSDNHWEFKYHCHDFLELSIVTSGVADYCIDGNNYTIKKGEVLKLPLFFIAKSMQKQYLLRL